MLRKSFPTKAILLGMLPGSVFAVGLGEIRAGSYLNQPLRAEIELVGVKAQEIDGVRVGLASEREFQKAGTVREPALGQLLFQPRVTPSGGLVVGVSSEEPIREPFLDFLVEVNWPQGRLVKEYTLLLDPPVTLPGIGPPPRLPVTTPVAPPRSSPPRAATSRTASATPPPATTPSAGGSALSYGPVRRGENLWRIAKRIKLPGASHQEVIQALFRANPEAFANGDVRRLRTGVVLHLGPSEGVAAEVPTAEPAGSAAARDPVAAPGPGQGPAPQDQLRILTPATSDTGAGMTAEPGARGEGLGALHRDLSLVREDTEVARQETTHLQERVQGIEGQLQDIRHLLDIRNTQISQLQQNLLGSETQGGGAVSGEDATKAATDVPAPAAAPPPATLPTEGNWLAGVRAGLAAALEGPSLLPTLVASVLALSLLVAYRVRRRSTVEPATASAGGSTGSVPMPLSELPSVAEPRVPVPPEAGQQKGRVAALVPPREAEVTEETDELAEADLFLGFGRYREAEQLVRAALQREPGRRELKVKLAEIYHGAGNATAFAAVLEELEAEQGAPLPPRTVDRLLAMAEGLGLDLAAARSLALAQEPNPPPLSPPLPPLESPREAIRRGAGPEIVAGSLLPLPLPEAAGTQGRGGEGLDVGLSLDLTAALAEMEQAERERAGVPSTTPLEAGGPHLDGGLSLEPLSEVLKPGATAEPPPAGAPPGQGVAFPSAASPDPEARRRAMREETNLIKLDLARAYLAMDDLTNARALLEEIVEEGEGAAREAAEALLATLG